MDLTVKRLLAEAAQHFSEVGYHRASVREICRRAGANTAAAHYHFGDKAGLYRAVLADLAPKTEVFSSGPESASVTEKLTAFYRALLLPPEGEARQSLYLRLSTREQYEPSGVLPDYFETLRPRHVEFTQFLAAQLGIAPDDLRVHRLAFSLVGLGFLFLARQPLVAAFCPQLLAEPTALEPLITSLVGQAEALIQHEKTMLACHEKITS